MKILAPKSFDEFLGIFEKYSNGGNDYYRGQADYSWDITPGLARNRSIKYIDNLLLIENKLIKQFEMYIQHNKLTKLIPIVNGSYHKSWIYLMVAQHYGLPTRLLDFSFDKFTALEFGVANIQYLNKDGALIIYNNADFKQENIDSELLKKPFLQTLNSFFLQVPSYKVSTGNKFNNSESRKIIQGSKFLYQNTENFFQSLSLDHQHTHNLTTILIPQNIKLDIIEWLIKIEKMAFNLYYGKNIIDYYCAILNDKYHHLNDVNIEEHFR